MPIPRYGEQQVAPREIDTPSAGGGQDPMIGAMGQLGGTIRSIAGEAAQYANEERQKADHARALDAIGEANSVYEAWQDKHSRASATEFLQGKNGTPYEQVAMEELQKDMSAVRDKLSTPQQKDILKQHVVGMFHQGERGLYRQKENLIKKYNDDAVKKGVETSVWAALKSSHDDAAFNPDDPNSAYNRVFKTQAAGFLAQGLPPDSDVAKQQTVELRSRLLTERLKTLSAEDPVKAKQLFESKFYQDNILDPKEREALSAKLKRGSMEAIAQDAAFEYQDALVSGKITLSEVKKQLHVKLKDYPEAAAHAMHFAESFDHDGKNQRSDQTMMLRGTAEQAYYDIVQSGRIPNLSHLKNNPAWKELDKLDYKEAVPAKDYLWKLYNNAAKTIGAEQRQAEKEALSEFNAYFVDPKQWVPSMKKADIVDLGHKLGVPSRAIEQRIKEYDSEKEKIVRASKERIHPTALGDILNRLDMPDLLAKKPSERSEDERKALQNIQEIGGEAIADAVKEKGQPLTAEEQADVITRALRQTIRQPVKGIRQLWAGPMEEVEAWKSTARPRKVDPSKLSAMELSIYNGLIAAKIPPESIRPEDLK